MGILDDAIREHLELKRQHGAESDDLERLEKEAFGPLTRPGDPDFADPGATDDGAESAIAEGAQGETAVAGDPQQASAGQGDWFSDEEETSLLPQEPTPSEQARVEHAGLGDTADHPAPELAEAPPAADPPEAIEAPAEPPEAPERAIFDADDIDFGELDIDLDDPAEGSAPSAPVESPEGGSGAADFGDLGEDLKLDLPDDPPAGSHQTASTERSANLIEDDEDAPPEPVPPRPEGDVGEEPGAEDGEDLLEETPDFLQDAPEGERLWFEQRPPRDFDFEDD